MDTRDSDREQIAIFNKIIKIEEQFDRLVRDVRLCNRRFVKNDLVSKIQEIIQDENQYETIKEGQILYRARLCSPDDCDKLGLRERGVKYGVCNRHISHWSNSMKVDTEFAGFDAENSGAPPAYLCGENRANGKGIKRLYVSEKAQTAITEVKPSLGNIISIAELKVITGSFKILDLHKHVDDDTAFIKYLIDQQFSNTSYGDSDSYSFTQWFTDLVASYAYKDKNKFEKDIMIANPKKARGIKFSSSMQDKGINYVIFGLYEDCGAFHDLSYLYPDLYKETPSYEFFGIKPIKSELYQILDIDMNFKQLKMERGDILKIEKTQYDKCLADISKYLKIHPESEQVLLDKDNKGKFYKVYYQDEN